MENTILEQTSNNQIPSAKLSPVTSAGKSSHFERQILQQNLNLDLWQHNQLPEIATQLVENRKLIKKWKQTNQQRFHQIQHEVMQYFQTKDVKAGHAQDFKKEYNKKLHKRASMRIEVNEILIQKANIGSSLLQRRRNKKMVITL